MVNNILSKKASGLPQKQGLYDPKFEKGSCGVGFVAHMHGEASHQIIIDAEHALCQMEHREGCGNEANTSHWAGILTSLPHDFFIKVMRRDFDVVLPEAGRYAVGNVFLPAYAAERGDCKNLVNLLIAGEGLELLAWREVPVDPLGAHIGETAISVCPHIEQLFVTADEAVSQEELERRLCLIRKKSTRLLRANQYLEQAETFYFCSLSSKVIIYKGMLSGEQVCLFYPDLRDADYSSHLAMVHSRFSTNTEPSWERAQPLRYMSHNGEINTFQGNLNRMKSRQGVMKSAQYGDKLSELFPVVEPDVSDSAAFDNVLEFLMLNGRSLQEAVSLMVPEAWRNDTQMPQSKRDFYEYNSMMMESWDGPASIAFTDGRYIGAVLDRNGLRSSHYYLTHDDHVIMASELDRVNIDPANVKYKDHLRPGEMFLLDFERGRLVNDDDLKAGFARRNPYGRWLRSQRIELGKLHTEEQAHGFDESTLLPRMQTFGYSVETMRFMLLPLGKEMRDPVGLMGNDPALACLSDKPKMLYDYFKQLFTQTTNPPIDSICEEAVINLACYIGPEGNLLGTAPEHAHRLYIPHPIISNEELAVLKHIDHKHLKYRHWRAFTIDLSYAKSEGVAGLQKALERICNEASQAIADDYSLIILSDRNMAEDRVPVSTLLASASVHQHLVRRSERSQVGIVLETGEAREVPHHCLLMGYGADAINPYLAFEVLWHSQREGLLPGESFGHDNKIVGAYRKAVGDGMLKVMTKMGISTLHSYKGAQIFEAIGLADEVVEMCFTDTVSRTSGVDMDMLAEENLRRHERGYPSRSISTEPVLTNKGEMR